MGAFPSVHGLLDAAVNVETQARKFYLTMPRAFDYIADVASMFHSFSADHGARVDLLREIQAGAEDSQLRVPVAPEAVSQAQGLVALLDDTCVSGLENLDQAYEFTRRIEEGEQRLLVSLVAAGVVPLGSLLRAREAHSSRMMLLQSERLFGTRAWRLRMPARPAENRSRLAS